MKSLIITAVTVLSTATASFAQIKNEMTTTVKVFGNCGMCETAIEKAGSKSKLYKTDWDTETKMATITYDSKKTNADAVLKSIALSGYDNANFLAPDEAYNKLHECCQYERAGSSAKNCCDDKKCSEEKCMKDGKCAKDMQCCKDSNCTSKDCCKS